MPMLFIKCPKTGKPTPTGMSAGSLSQTGGFKSNSAQCQHCGQMHTWDGKDAFFLDDKK